MEPLKGKKLLVQIDILHLNRENIKTEGHKAHLRPLNLPKAIDLTQINDTKYFFSYLTLLALSSSTRKNVSIVEKQSIFRHRYNETTQNILFLPDFLRSIKLDQEKGLWRNRAFPSMDTMKPQKIFLFLPDSLCSIKLDYKNRGNYGTKAFSGTNCLVRSCSAKKIYKTIQDRSIQTMVEQIVSENTMFEQTIDCVRI